jgi:DNA-binding transcriptional MocR family regulator
MNMLLELDRKSPKPLYRQVYEALKEKIERGVLPAGTVLPPSRRMARINGINRVTVQNAYKKLAGDALISAKVGRGTTVVYEGGVKKRTETRPRRPSGPAWVNAPGRENARPYESTLRNMIQSALEEGGVNLALSQPSPDYFPINGFRRCMNHVLRTEGKTLLQHGTVAGYRPLRVLLKEYMSRNGIETDEDDIIIVSGIQQGLDLLSRIFLERGDGVLMEAPTYPGAIELFYAIGARCHFAPLETRRGWGEGLASQLARHKVSLVYTIPVCHNPTGLVMPMADRKAFLERLAAFPVPIIEDFSMGELLYHGESLPLKALDTRRQVIFLGSFSKQLFPGIRLGWIAASRRIIDRLKILKQTSDLHSSLVVQGALVEFWQRGELARHIRRCRKIYRERLIRVLAALEKYFPPDITWLEPAGGFSIWLTLPESIDGADFFSRAKDRGVVCCPGILFYGEGSGRHRLRLSFARPAGEQLEQGIRILGELAKDTIAKKSKRSESRLLNF